MAVAFKLRRGAAALSSLLPLTGRFISLEICTDHTSLTQAVSVSEGPPGFFLRVVLPGRGLLVSLPIPSLFTHNLLSQDAPILKGRGEKKRQPLEEVRMKMCLFCQNEG